MGKSKGIWLSIVGILIFIGWLIPTNNQDLPEQTPTNMAQPTKTPLPTNTPTPTTVTDPPSSPKPAPVNYWAAGLKVEDITNNTSRMCTFDMCVFLKLTAVKTCSSISLEGIVYNVDGEEVDDFSDTLPKLAKGKSRIVEFGTDAVEDTDEEVELDSSTCWK